MKSSSLVPIAVLATLLAATSAVGQSEPIEITVDCDAGDDLARAIRNTSAGSDGSDTQAVGPVTVVAPRRAPLVVNIRGTCTGNYVIDRDDVLLRGISPSESVLLGALDPDGDPVGDVIEIHHAHRVFLENLTIARGDYGVSFSHSGGGVHGCTARDNRYYGIYLSHSDAFVENSLVDSNGWDGLVAYQASFAFVIDCTVTNHRRGITSNSGSDVVVTGATMAGNTDALFAFRGASLLVSSPLNIRAERRAMGVSSNSWGQLFSYESTDLIEGPVTVSSDGGIDIFGATVNGDVWLGQFGKAYISSTTVQGTLTCMSGGDAYCRSSHFNAVSGCAQCLSDFGADASEEPDPERPDLPDSMRSLLAAYRSISGRSSGEGGGQED